MDKPKVEPGQLYRFRFHSGKENYYLVRARKEGFEEAWDLINLQNPSEPAWERESAIRKPDGGWELI